ncbi:ABC transporter ATP-binding protein [Tautonia rosea]|uniref:ABC transporter ATP-binding protein n=1 Tax=Tautonia rosea TaxID=2728037 RepID=UPI00147661C7|nr:polysaccharide ABC transporter ATP-binding protein [Tautonia rosea]
MSNTAISVEGLSKLYRIGLAEERHESLLSASIDAIKKPLKNFRKLWRLDTSRSGAEDEEDLIWALRDVSFEVPRGEVLGVIGRNGAGKSTLLKILSRVTAPTSGRVVVNGRVSSLLEVGTGFHPELTGRDNIYLNGTILGMTRREIDRKFEEIVEFSGISKFLDTPIKRYSSGMKVRLAFSVAAHLEPEILIIDEVLAVGDVEFQNKCMGKMQQLSDTSGGARTVLFVSHNMNAINRLCTRGIVMNQGGVHYDGPVEDAVRAYMDLNVKNGSRYESGLDRSRDAQIFQIEVLDGLDETPQNDVDSDRGFLIRIGVFSQSRRPSGFLTMSLRDSLGIPVLFTDMRDSDRVGIPEGITYHTIRVPARLLAPLEYAVTVALNDPFKGPLDRATNQIKFTVHDHSSKRGGSRIGYFGGVLPWELATESEFQASRSTAS